MAVNALLIKELRELTQAGMMDCKKALEATDGNIENAIVWLRENGLAKAAKKSDRVAAEGVSLAKENNENVVVVEVNSETDFVAQNENFISLINEVADTILSSNVTTLDEALNLKSKSDKTIKELLINATATIGEKIELRRFALIKKEKGYTTSLYNHSNKRVSVVLKFKGDLGASDAYNVAMHVAAMSPKYKTQSDIPAEFVVSEFSIIKAEAKEDTKLQNKPENVLENILKGKLTKVLSQISLVDQEYVVDEKFKVGEFLKSKKVEINQMVRYEVGEGIEKLVTDFASEVAAQLGSN